MPSTLTFPGVYIEEIPSGVRTIVGVSTSDTAFVDFFRRGPVNQAVRITSFTDFERVFGGLDTRSEASYGIQQFYLNGGSIAWVIRVVGAGAAPALRILPGPGGNALRIEAASPGLWGDNLDVGISHIAGGLFNLVVREVATVGGRRQVINNEIYRNLSPDPNNSRFAVSVVNSESALVRLFDLDAAVNDLPNETDETDPNTDVSNPNVISNVTSPAFDPLSGGNNGSAPDSAALIAGMNALDQIAPFIFNILCIPAAANLPPAAPADPLNPGPRGAVYAAAKTFCENRRAFLIVDIPQDFDTIQEITGWMGINEGSPSRNAAVYYPRLIIPDALNENRPRNVAASGTMAGVYSRTDANRGVWKAPAGTDTSLRGANLARKLTDPENGGLNVLGINVLRNFPIFGNVSWGARTLEGADQAASEWKYIPVRRTALYIEQSLFDGLKWVVFEPNDEPLWAQIRLNVGAFMQNLFRQGAFQGKTPREAYFVRCDRTTTTQDDINRGIVNILVGFAPLKPAEFVVIKIQQMAGQIET